MVVIAEVIEVNGRKFVALEDFQALIAKYEELQPVASNAEIIAEAGEDEVYNG